jgi:hypothetical protein
VQFLKLHFTAPHNFVTQFGLCFQELYRPRGLYDAASSLFDFSMERVSRGANQCNKKWQPCSDGHGNGRWNKQTVLGWGGDDRNGMGKLMGDGIWCAPSTYSWRLAVYSPTFAVGRCLQPVFGKGYSISYHKELAYFPHLPNIFELRGAVKSFNWLAHCLLCFRTVLGKIL